MTTTAEKVLKEMEGIKADQLQLLSSFDQQKINTIPYEGSWTAAQVGDHIFKSDTMFLKALYGPVKQSERDPAEKIEGIKEVFLNFNTKLKSPKVIIPAIISHDRETLLNSLKGTATQLTEAVQKLDLSEICLTPLPASDELTRLEIMYFIVYHTQRHIHQLQKISKALQETTQ
jgi:hypothetical protein